MWTISCKKPRDQFSKHFNIYVHVFVCLTLCAAQTLTLIPVQTHHRGTGAIILWTLCLLGTEQIQDFSTECMCAQKHAHKHV